MSADDFRELFQKLEDSGLNYRAYRVADGFKMAVNADDIETVRKLAGKDIEAATSDVPFSPPEKNIIGNAEYRYIPQKEYFSADRDLILKMADEMQKQGIKFSGRIYPTGKGTLTVSRDDLALVRSVRDNIIDKRRQVGIGEKGQAKAASEYVTLRKVGDFYEMYGKNAQIGEEVLGLRMLSKNGLPMVGFPAQVKDEYSEKLYEAGYSVLIEQAFELNPPKREVEKSIETPLDKAKELINDFCETEYRDGADFSDLHNVGLAFTTLTDDELPIQITADLIDFKITYEFDGEVYNTEQYDSIEQMIDNGLTGLDFSDLVSVPDEVIDRHIGKDEQLAAPASDIDDDAPLFSDESLLDLEKSENSGSFDDNVKGEQLSFFSEPVEQTKIETRTEKPKSEFASGPIIEGGAKSKFRANVEAIKTLEAENRPATADEKETLSKYVGRGAIPQDLRLTGYSVSCQKLLNRLNIGLIRPL